MNNAPDAVLTESAREALRERLLQLLAAQTALYTMGESSSVREQTAEELLRSICYCLGISDAQPPGRLRALSELDLGEELKVGLRRVEERLGYCGRLWNAVCAAPPPVTSCSMRDTLKSIGEFRKKYDYRFFAHDIPCSIDYQLAVGVPEAVQGVDYINMYLERLWLENRFMSQYDKAALEALFDRYCPDYSQVPVNLFEPVFANTLGLALLGRHDGTLRIGAAELEEISAIFDCMTPAQIARRVRSTAAVMASACAGPGMSAYLIRCAEPLSVRIAAMRDTGGLAGVFSSD